MRSWWRWIALTAAVTSSRSDIPVESRIGSSVPRQFLEERQVRELT